MTLYLDGAHTTDSMLNCATWFKEESEKEKIYEESNAKNFNRVLLFNLTGCGWKTTWITNLEDACKDCSFNDSRLIEIFVLKCRSPRARTVARVFGEYRLWLGDFLPKFYNISLGGNKFCWSIKSGGGWLFYEKDLYGEHRCMEGIVKV